MSGQPHDALVKRTFEDLDSARGELRAVLRAKVTELIDWQTLQLEKGSFVDPTLRARITDMLFSVQLAGRDARIYLLFEHQSEVDHLMPFKVLALSRSARRAARVRECPLRARTAADGGASR